MSQPVGNSLYCQSTGTTSTDVFIAVVSDVDPGPSNTQFPVQKRWINIVAGREWFLAGFISTDGIVTANWIHIGSGGGTGILTATGNSGGAVGPDGSNNINLEGDGTSINTVGNPGTHTLTSNVILPAQYDVLASDTSSISGISPSTSGFVLTSNGPSAFATFQAAAGSSLTLTPDSGGAVSPVAGTIDVTGYPQTTSGAKGVKTFNGGAGIFQISNLDAVTSYVVGDSNNTSAYTTIASAISAAVSDGASSSHPALIYITSGTYTETLVLQPYVYLVGLSSGPSAAVIINGATTTSVSGTGAYAATNISFSIATGSALSVQGSNSFIFYLQSVLVQSSGGSSGVGALSLQNASVTMNLTDSVVIGNSVSPMYADSGTINLYTSHVIATTSTGSLFIGGTINYYSSIIQDVISNQGGALHFYGCYGDGGSNPFIENAGSNISMYGSTIHSTAGSGYYISNAGGSTITYGDIVVTGSAQQLESTLTQAGNPVQVRNLSFDGGVTTNNIDGGLWIGSGLVSGKPVAATLTAGTGVSIANGHNSITISAVGGGFTWSSQATSFAAASGNGYLITATATATLPTGAGTGSTISFISNITTGMGNLTIQCATGDFISIGVVSGAASGNAVNTAYGDSVTLTYIAAELTWYATSVIGSWTVS